MSHSFVERDARVRRTIGALADDGWDVEVLALDPPRREGRVRSWRVPMERRRGSPGRYLFEYGLFFLATLGWILWRVVAGRRVALVYVNSLPDFLVFAALPARLRHIPVILDVHDPMPELFGAKGRRSRLVRSLLERQERASLRFADRVITVHDPLRELLASRSPSVEIDVVMNVPDTSQLSSVESDPASRTLVYAGSIARRYGLDDVVRAMAEVASDIPSLRLRLIGEGEDLAGLQDLADELGIGDRIDYRGTVPWAEVAAAQRGAWLGVNVPKPDPLGELSFSNKIVEWIVMGLPVVASRTATLLRYFPEETLFYADAASPASIAAVLRMLDGAGLDLLEERMAAAGAALARIAWPVQRERLLAVVRAATQDGQT